MICQFEILRAFIMTKFASAGASQIPASSFSVPVFGPIFCGTLGGCGSAFWPLNKGLDPILKGLAPPMVSAFIAATGYHLFLNTTLSEGVIEPEKKAQVVVAVFFAFAGLANAFDWQVPGGHHVGASTKKES